MFGLSSLEDLRAARDERNVYSLRQIQIALRAGCDVKRTGAINMLLLRSVAGRRV